MMRGGCLTGKGTWRTRCPNRERATMMMGEWSQGGTKTKTLLKDALYINLLKRSMLAPCAKLAPRNAAYMYLSVSAKVYVYFLLFRWNHFDIMVQTAKL